MLDPTEYLDLAARSADAAYLRMPLIERDEYHSQVLVSLVESCNQYDASHGVEPGHYLRIRLRTRLLDYARQEIGRNGTHKQKFRLMGIARLDDPDFDHQLSCHTNVEREVIARDECRVIINTLSTFTDRERDYALHEWREQPLGDIESRYGLLRGAGGGVFWKKRARKRLRKAYPDY